MLISFQVLIYQESILFGQDPALVSSLLGDRIERSAWRGPE